MIIYFSKIEFLKDPKKMIVYLSENAQIKNNMIKNYGQKIINNFKEISGINTILQQKKIGNFEQEIFLNIKNFSIQDQCTSDDTYRIFYF